MAGLWKQVRDVNKAVVVFNDTTLVAFGANVQSGWIDCSQYEDMVILRSNTSGTYALEIDWSADGAVAHFTEAVTTTASVPLKKDTAAPYMRIRVRNTDGAVNFSAHRTMVTL